MRPIDRTFFGFVLLAACSSTTVDASDGGTDASDAAVDAPAGDAATCPAASSVISGSACPSAGLACDGTILNNCGASIGSQFACICSGGDVWQCEGPDASGAICDAGSDG